MNKSEIALDYILTGLVRLFDLFPYDPTIPTRIDKIISEEDGKIRSILEMIRNEYKNNKD